MTYFLDAAFHNNFFQTNVFSTQIIRDTCNASGERDAHNVFIPIIVKIVRAFFKN